MGIVKDDYYKYFHKDRNFNPKRPNGSDLLVRFLSLTKAIHLFARQELHFQRIDKFKDKDEGLWTESDVVALNAVGPFDLARFTNNFRETTAITCWSKANESLDESWMWEEYAPNNQGLAVVSDASELCTQVKSGLSKMGADYVSAIMVEVEYVDRSSHSNVKRLEAENCLPNALLTYYQKNIDPYKRENEVRLLLHAGLNGKQTMAVLEGGVDIPINIYETIKEIWLPPVMPIWERNAVTELLKRFDLARMIMK